MKYETQWVRVSLRVGLIAFLALALSGCATFAPVSKAPQRTDAVVLHELESIPGVSSVQLFGGVDGLPGQNSAGAGLVLEPGYVNDRSMLLDYVLKLLWSQDVVEPNTVVMVTMRIGDATAVPLDLIADGRALGLTNDGPVGFHIRSGQMTAHYGQWPGTVPTLPATLASSPPSASPTP